MKWKAGLHSSILKILILIFAVVNAASKFQASLWIHKKERTTSDHCPWRRPCRRPTKILFFSANIVQKRRFSREHLSQFLPVESASYEVRICCSCLRLRWQHIKRSYIHYILAILRMQNPGKWRPYTRHRGFQHNIHDATHMEYAPFTQRLVSIGVSFNSNWKSTQS